MNPMNVFHARSGRLRAIAKRLMLAGQVDRYLRAMRLLFALDADAAGQPA